MLRGVNKRIIEINDLENDCFYKAIFFVRPERDEKGNEKLEQEAKQIAEHTLLGGGVGVETAEITYGYLRTKRRRRRIFLIAASAALLVAAIVSFILLF